MITSTAANKLRVCAKINAEKYRRSFGGRQGSSDEHIQGICKERGTKRAGKRARQFSEVISAQTLRIVFAFVALLFFAAAGTARAGAYLSPWLPLYQGVDYATGTNTPSAAGMPDLQVMRCVRVDLTDPDVRFITTPRIPNFVLDKSEVAGTTVSNFLMKNQVQIAINANYFYQGSDPFGSPDYNLPQGTPFVVSGLLMSQGQVVVPQEGSPNYNTTLVFSSNNVPAVTFTNWPVKGTNGAYTAVTGTYPLLVNGFNVGTNYLNSGQPLSGINPRTAFGISQDNHYLYLMVIDGRQPGYSDGALDWETATWLQMVGAYQGMNMDGGGSSTLVRADTTGLPIPLNKSSAVASDGRERTAGSMFGVYANPVPGFFNNVTANPDDIAATITWTTIVPATTQILFGTNPASLNLSTTVNTTLATNHAVLLTGLAPSTSYYFSAIATIAGNTYTSSNFLFTTTNYVTVNPLFDVTNAWTYTSADLDGVNWTAPGYDDSGWQGAGPGLLWADAYGPGFDPYVTPENTALPLDPNNNGYPYITYYFRTHFNFTNNPSGVALQFAAYVDDGGVFYLNGQEIYRLRMPSDPILNSTLAATYNPCVSPNGDEGDATCADEFLVSGTVMTNLVSGDNVMAVEVHNFNALSHGVTFGAQVMFTEPNVPAPALSMAPTGNTATLSWTRGGFLLQQAPALTAPWTNSPGPVVASPYSVGLTNSSLFFRLAR